MVKVCQILVHENSCSKGPSVRLISGRIIIRATHSPIYNVEVRKNRPRAKQE